MRWRAGVLSIALAGSACSDERLAPVPPAGHDVGGAGGAGGAAPLSYPADPSPLTGAACEADQAASWPHPAPAACSGRRTCIDERRRLWVDGAPFFPRGVYNGGYEYARLLDNCPAGAECEATTPANAAGYVAMLDAAGLNLIMDRSRFLAAELLDAIHASPQMRLAHLLWSDPFTVEGHDAMVADIVAAAADDDVVMWFGPDEIDLNSNWAEAAGIRRILRGASPALDALLAGPYAPGGTPYLPADEPAHDPHGLPFGAALAYDPGLQNGTDVYDVLLPVTYPFNEPYSLANEGIWGTWRVSYFAGEGAPIVPVLQMVGIAEMGLSQPSPGQLEGQLGSALAHGARGAFYYNLIGDKPSFAGREGWFAADDAAAWAALTRVHALVDRLLAVTHGPAEETSGTHAHLEWRRWSLGERSVVLVANPTPYARSLDLEPIVALGDGRFARAFSGCQPFTAREQVFPPYATLVLEVYP
jgi:hypothetical protein